MQHASENGRKLKYLFCFSSLFLSGWQVGIARTTPAIPNMRDAVDWHQDLLIMSVVFCRRRQLTIIYTVSSTSKASITPNKIEHHTHTPPYTIPTTMSRCTQCAAMCDKNHKEEAWSMWAMLSMRWERRRRVNFLSVCLRELVIVHAAKMSLSVITIYMIYMKPW